MLNKFHYPSEIQLTKNPLLEAWLTIQWKLETGESPQAKTDPKFPFALGVFYERIAERFSYRQPLDASRVPEEMLPHMVRYQFRSGKGKSPILQLGPGVASANFTRDYSWSNFRELCSYLRRNLLDAYDGALQAQKLALRYRNGVPFDRHSNNMLDFFEKNLNTIVRLPEHIPGAVSSAPWPIQVNTIWNFELLEPKGLGTIHLTTGSRRKEDAETKNVTTEEMLIWQLEVVSEESDAPNINQEDEFSDWLELAHAVMHEWFFSLIEGPLFGLYKSGENYSNDSSSSAT